MKKIKITLTKDQLIDGVERTAGNTLPVSEKLAALLVAEKLATVEKTDAKPTNTIIETAPRNPGDGQR